MKILQICHSHSETYSLLPLLQIQFQVPVKDPTLNFKKYYMFVWFSSLKPMGQILFDPFQKLYYSNINMYIIRFIISRHFNTLFYVYVVCVENSNCMCFCCERCYGLQIRYLFYYTVKVYNFECIRSVSDLFVILKEIAICSDKGGLVRQTVIPFCIEIVCFCREIKISKYYRLTFQKSEEV